MRESPEARRQAAADARAAGHSLRTAGEAAGVAHTTVMRWEREPDFYVRVESQRATLLDVLAKVATAAWAQSFDALAAGEYSPSEAAKVAGIASTNYARIVSTLPAQPLATVDEQEPVTDQEIREVQRMVQGWSERA